ncbi:MAG: hypothetical protein R3B70_03705 [Polyangiaceae bacterium]
MMFADLKNDFVFRRIFATHPDLLRSLLNDLLERSGPTAGADLWAWLFVHAPHLTEVPSDLEPGPYRAALELANKATFTQDELDAYRKVIDEILQVRELVDAKLAEGKALGLAEGEALGLAKGEALGLAKGEALGFAKGEALGILKGKIAALLSILAARGMRLSPEVRSRIEACTDDATVDDWLSRAGSSPSLEDLLTPLPRST